MSKMVRVDGAGAARARREEQDRVLLPVCVEHELHGESALRQRRRSGLRQRAGERQLALALRPDDRIDLGLDDAARIGRQRDLGLVAGLHFVQLVLPEEGEDDVILFDEAHDRQHRQLRDRRARAQLQVDHVAVGRRIDRRFVQLPLRVLAAAPGSARRRPARRPTWASSFSRMDAALARIAVTSCSAAASCGSSAPRSARCCSSVGLPSARPRTDRRRRTPPAGWVWPSAQLRQPQARPARLDRARDRRRRD